MIPILEGLPMPYVLLKPFFPAMYQATSLKDFNEDRERGNIKAKYLVLPPSMIFMG